MALSPLDLICHLKQLWLLALVDEYPLLIGLTCPHHSLRDCRHLLPQHPHAPVASARVDGFQQACQAPPGIHHCQVHLYPKIIWNIFEDLIAKYDFCV